MTNRKKLFTYYSRDKGENASCSKRFFLNEKEKSNNSRIK